MALPQFNVDRYEPIAIPDPYPESEIGTMVGDMIRVPDGKWCWLKDHEAVVGLLEGEIQYREVKWWAVFIIGILTGAAIMLIIAICVHR